MLAIDINRFNWCSAIQIAITFNYIFSKMISDLLQNTFSMSSFNLKVILQYIKLIIKYIIE